MAKLVRRLEFEKAIASSEEEPTSSKVRRMILDQACEVDPSYTGPRLAEEEVEGEGGRKVIKMQPTLDFVKGAIKLFQEGKLLPRRYVFEIVLGCREILMKEKSMTEFTIPEGQTCDV